jgi:membrane-associated phospholipid phosphatase
MAILAAWFLPRQLFQAFAVSFFIIMLIGFTIWIVFPAYVIKAPFTPGNIFDEWTRDLHIRDRDYGNHNALPSSHVYYITLLLYFFARKWPRGWFLWVTLAVINAWSTMLTHQHYFLDVLAGFVLTIFVLWITYNMILPPLRRSEQRQHRTAIS